jgi:tRNA-dihydrouridine synthase A
MIDVTDRHCRFLLRLLSKNARLYTEMITCPAIIHGDQDYLLGYDASEQPLAIQLGGSKPEEFAYCAKIIEERNYDEININVGCPSDRVQAGMFGACLMKEPNQVADCFSALAENSELPITVKCRIGVDDLDNDEFLQKFISTLADAGCQTFIIHARIAILKGLSPKENRSVPPLNYERVKQLKNNFSDLNIVLNGGIQSIASSKKHLKCFDGVMLGREVYKDLMLLNKVDREIYNQEETYKSRAQVVEAYLPYMEQQMNTGLRAHSMARHLVGLFHEQKLSRKWRQFISSNPINSPTELSNLVELAKTIEDANTQNESTSRHAYA